MAVTSTKGSAIGSILTVEKRIVPAEKDRPATPSHFLVIASDSGEISSFDLADVRGVKLLDEGTKRDLNEFANATASTRRRDAKTITVTSTGTGQRESKTARHSAPSAPRDAVGSIVHLHQDRRRDHPARHADRGADADRGDYPAFDPQDAWSFDAA